MTLIRALLFTLQPCVPFVSPPLLPALSSLPFFPPFLPGLSSCPFFPPFLSALSSHPFFPPLLPLPFCPFYTPYKVCPPPALPCSPCLVSSRVLSTFLSLPSLPAFLGPPPTLPRLSSRPAHLAHYSSSCPSVFLSLLFACLLPTFTSLLPVLPSLFSFCPWFCLTSIPSIAPSQISISLLFFLSLLPLFPSLFLSFLTHHSSWSSYPNVYLAPILPLPLVPPFPPTRLPKPRSCSYLSPPPRSSLPSYPPTQTSILLLSFPSSSRSPLPSSPFA